MLTLNYRYRIYPNTIQLLQLSGWMETCRVAYNYGLREIKDWLGSRKCAIDRCSLVHEYIIPASARFPSEVDQLNALPKAKLVFPRLSEVPSQVLQQAIKQLHRSWEGFQQQGHGFPRFKKFGQFKSLLFPQFKKSPFGVAQECHEQRRSGKPIVGTHIELPKLGQIRVKLHRPVPDGFSVKQVRIIKKADRWYVSIAIQCDVNIPDPIPHGHPIGVDVGLNSFLATSDGVVVKAPKFFKDLQSKLKLLRQKAV